VAAGQTVTALYEVVPAARPTTRPSGSATPQLLALTLRYRLSGAADAMAQQFAATDESRPLPEASADFRFAAAVASFGLALRAPAPARADEFEHVMLLAAASRGADEDGSRAAFVDLVKKARELKRA